MRDTIKTLYHNLFSPKERKKILQAACSDIATLEKRIVIVRANRNELFEKNIQLQTTLNESNKRAERLTVQIDKANAECVRGIGNCERALKELKEFKSMHEGKMDAAAEVIYQQKLKLQELVDEVKHQQQRVNNADDQLVWLASWCKKEFGVANNDVIGKEDWPNKLVEVVAKVVDAQIEELDDKIESLESSLRGARRNVE